MIAIKQAKFKPSNKIQENQIKNFIKPANVAQTNNGQHQHHQHQHLSTKQAIISSKNDNHPCQVRAARAKPQQQQDGTAAVTLSASDNNHQQQQQQQQQQQRQHNNQQQLISNETRSETRERIDGATTASATPTKSSPAPPLPLSSSSSCSTATGPTRPPQPSTATSSLSAAGPASALSTGTPMAVRQARSQQPLLQHHHQPATSLTNASVKIQQRQQQFLAAAARSATSPQCHLDQNLSVIKQHAEWTNNRTPAVSANSESCCGNNAASAQPKSVRLATSEAAGGPSLPLMPPNGCTWRSRACTLSSCTTSNCCSGASAVNSSRRGAAGSIETAADQKTTTTSTASLGERRQQSQQTSPRRQTVLLSTPCKNEALDSETRSKVLSMATMLSGSCVPDQGSAGSRNPDVDKLPRAADNDHSRSTFTSGASVDAAAVTATTATAASDSCGTSATTPFVVNAAATAAASNVSDINHRGPARSSKCDANNLTGSYQQQVVSPQYQRPVRPSGDVNKDNDDNITNKITKHNIHFHYHHYYNQNYLNFHRLQQHHHHHQQPQQQQPQLQQQSQAQPKQQPQHTHQNYFHLQQYQQAPQQIINSPPNQTTTQHQQQPIMAHYKFHNDCQSSVLTYEQVKRLDFVMDQTVPIHGRGNSPTLYVKLKELIRLVKYKLQHEHSIEIRDVRLNGGAASYVLAPENSKYNDLDLVFGTDLSNEDRFDVIRDVVLDCLMEFYPTKTQAQVPGHQSTTSCDSDSLGVNEGSKLTSGVAAEGDDEDDDYSSGQPSRSHRSSSFESDNLNVTTNELDDDVSDDDDDDEDNIIVRIDSDDTGCDVDTKSEEQEDGRSDQSRVPVETEDASQVVGHGSTDNNKISCERKDDAVMSDANKTIIRQADYPYPGYQYQYNQMPPTNCAFKEAYVHKMVKVNDDDRWSLISLGVQQSETNSVHQPQQASTGCNQQTSSSAPSNSINNSNRQQLQSQQQQQQQQQAHASNAKWCEGSSGQQKQLPNSIELKFVDRMRRKFEFSVDSFQIILDSLIQFYDYAPQSTITIQRTAAPGTVNLTMNPVIFNANPLVNMGRCLQCDCQQEPVSAQAASRVSDNVNKCRVARSDTEAGGKATERSSPSAKYAGRAHCEPLSDARNFYELPLEPGNPLSNSSVASSSGCSSSSSVVSSSSSSLSCDEDQEDLYCDGDNSPSSSASTSSLLSSTTTSGTGSPCDPLLESKPQQRQQHQRQESKSSGSQNCHSGYRCQVVNGDQQQQQRNFVACSDIKRNQPAYQVPSGISNYRQHHVNIRSFSENLCKFGTSKISSCAVISKNFYPTVIGRSEYGNFKEALYHLEKKLIATRSPEEIRGGGLLKYCNLLVKNYKPTNVYQIRTLERYMCSRFFIDFSDLNQQRAKLESYLANHFSDDAKQKFDYLTILYNVVQRSTVCLMNHELRLTLNMIRELAYNLPQHVQ